MHGKCLWAAIVLPGVFAGFATVSLALNTVSWAQTNRTSFRFAFGPGKVEPGYIQVLPTTVYTKELGYGFDLGSTVSAVDRGGDDLLHGGIPVLVTSMHRRTFNDEGKITNSLGDYPEAVRQAAKEDNVALIDLNEMSKLFYEALGPENSKKAFVDNTHHNNYGSYELAKCIVGGIKANKLGIAKFLVDEAETAFDPAHPDPIESFRVPASPMPTTREPAGNSAGDSPKPAVAGKAAI